MSNLISVLLCIQLFFSACAAVNLGEELTYDIFEVLRFIIFFTDVPVSTAQGLTSETPDSNWVVSYRGGQATGAIVGNVAGWSMRIGSLLQ
jgi:hypothetical protein